MGLFGVVGVSGTVRNVGVVNVNVTGGGSTGGLVGWNAGTVTNFFASGSVTGSRDVGGLVGTNSGTVRNSSNSGSVTATSLSAGGLVGWNVGGTVTNSFASGSVSSPDVGGGLVGWNAGTVTNSFSAVIVTGTSRLGGLIGGGIASATVTNSFWNIETSGQASSAGGTGRTTAEMSTLASFTGVTPAWDIAAVANGGVRNTNSIWNIVDGVTHPFLSWQPVTLTLAIISATGGNVTRPGTGGFAFARTTVVSLMATPHAGFRFVNWTGHVGTIANVNAANTTIRMDGNYTVTANFVPVYTLTMAVAPTGGGTATDLTAASPYTAGAVVNIRAVPAAGFKFVNWTAVPAVTFGNPAATTTTFTMPAQNVTLTANFEFMFAGGDGSAGNPFQIVDWHHLNNVRNHLSSHFILKNNLDETTPGYAEWASSTANGGAGWLPIGTDAARFTGNFNGQRLEIRGLFINRPTTDDVGLFGVVGWGGVIRNVGVVNINVRGRLHVGGLVGRKEHGKVINSFATGSIHGGVGVSDCLGGLVGWMIGDGSGFRGIVSNSFATVSVSGHRNAGGLVGWNGGGARIINSYASGSVTIDSGRNAGGLVGVNYGGYIFYSFSTGNVTGPDGVGGLVGQHLVGHVTASFWDINTSGQTYSAGGPGAMGRTTAEMKNITTFRDANVPPRIWSMAAVANPHLRDTTRTWNIVNGVTYPFLSWQPGYSLTMSVAPSGGGLATDLIGALSYPAGTVVNIQAVAATGFRFVNWTAPAGTIGSPTSATTTFTMPAANVTVTANFECMFAATAITLYGAQDEGAYYPIWVNNANQGFGFMPWEMNTWVASPDYAGFSTGNPALRGITGMDALSFRLRAASNGGQVVAHATRPFKIPLPIGSAFCFEWRPVLTNVSTGNASFALMAGSTSTPTVVFEVIKAHTGVVSIQGNPMFTQPGSHPMRLKFTRVAETSMRVSGTGMNGTELFDQTFTIAAIPNHFRFRAFVNAPSETIDVYFSNLHISTGTAGVLPTSSVQIRGRVLLDENIATGNLLIDPGHSLHVNPQRQLTVNNLLRNLGGTGGLFLRSNAAGAGATLLHNTAGVNAAMERVFPGARQWRLLSSAVASQAITGPWTPAAPNHGYDFYAWDEPAATWRNQKVTANNITHFVPGRGYLVSFEAADLIQHFTGPLNNGNVTVPVVRQNTGPFAGANLLGNPYPSAIDWHLADRTLFTDHFAYVYDRVTTGHGTTEGFFPVNGAVPGALIAPNQGFFVLKRNPGSANFTFTNAMRTHGGVFKSAPAHERITLTLSHNGWFDQTEINNKPGSSPVREANDALKFFSYNSLMPQIYSLSSDGIRLAINSAGQITQESEFRIGIKAPAAGQYTLQVEGIANAFAGLPVFLRDLVTGAVHNLRENPRISFQSPKTEPAERFVLSFVQPTQVSDLPSDATRIFYANGMLHLQFAREDNNRQLQVIDLTGRVVLSKNLHGMGTSITVPLQAEPGAYIVRITGEDTAVGQRILVR